jgi:hypothetical protein
MTRRGRTTVRLPHESALREIVSALRRAMDKWPTR